MGDAWRRWLVALTVSLAAHAAIVAGLLSHQRPTRTATPAVLVELIAPPEPSTRRPLERPPVRLAPPASPPDRAAAMPSLVEPAREAPVVTAPTAPAPATASAPGPAPLYAERGAPRRRACWEPQLSGADKRRCAELGIEAESRLAVADDKDLPENFIDPDKLTAFAAAPKRPPIRLQGAAEYCNSNGCVISPDGVILGFTYTKKF